MPIRLNTQNIAALKPKPNNWIEYDTGVRGFGVRVSPAAVKSFILTYRIDGHQRRITLGAVGIMGVSEARRAAEALVGKIATGIDPLDEDRRERVRRQHDRAAPTVADLVERYIEEHLPTKRPRSQVEDRTMIKLYILPHLGEVKIADVDHSAVSRLHRTITKAGHAPRANAVKRLLSKMFKLAMLWGYRSDDPTVGVVMNTETPRERYLTPDEVQRLMQALTRLEDREAGNVIMLALLTGARRNELVRATWAQFDLKAGVWTKPSSHTKQKRSHRVPLTRPALELLKAIRADTHKAETMVFPTRAKLGVRAAWESVREDAGLPDVRFHDLRHSFASMLISDGVSLHIVGGMLGHTQAQTTQRYAHIADGAMRDAADRIGRLIARK
jgi:integrase